MRYLLFLLLTASVSLGTAQEKLTWEMLSDVTFTSEYDPDYDMVIQYPKFSDEILELDGKEVYIKGFLIPIDIEDGMFALSMNPYQSCFFCGAAGPETVIELELNARRRYLGFEMDEVLTFKGTLNVNSDDALKLIYILEDAELYYGK